MNQIAHAGLIVMLFTLTQLQLNAQTRVNGHVFAEVIEPTTASGNLCSSIYLSPCNAGASFLLGEISLAGGAHSTVALLIYSDHLAGEDGSQVCFDAELNYPHPTATLNDQGQHIFKVNGAIGESTKGIKGKNYSTQLAFVFAYN